MVVLLVDQGGETRFIEDLTCHLLQIVGCQAVDVAHDVTQVAFLALM